MKKSSYAGHAKNLASHEALINFCTLHSDRYNPSSPLIQLATHMQKKAEVVDVLERIRTSKTVYSNVTNYREIAFANLPTHSTRVLNALRACGASEQTINDALTSHRKLQGRRKTPKEKPEATTTTSETTEPKKYNSTQLSYDAKVENFASLVATVLAEELYQPNEDELTTNRLQEKLGELRATNTAVIEAVNSINKERGERDKIMYDPKDGQYVMAAETKQYIRSIYGATSHEAKEVGAIRFTNHKE